MRSAERACEGTAFGSIPAAHALVVSYPPSYDAVRLKMLAVSEKYQGVWEYCFNGGSPQDFETQGLRQETRGELALRSTGFS